MKKAWRLLEVDYPEILFLDCIAHSLNLLVSDIMKLSWKSLATCFNSLVRNQLALKLAITELAHDNHAALPYTVSEAINCENFW
ncbi:18623_t:CDS:2, partial [Gigaspora rosea]